MSSADSDKGTVLRAALEARRKARRETALARSRAVLRHLAALGVEARVHGSLVEGGFADHSDVDFAILSCPDALRWRIEAGIEDLMGAIPFDCTYLDEVPAERAERILRHAQAADDLR